MSKMMGGVIANLWWRFMPGESITVVWPVGDIRVRQEPSGLWDYVRSADPNDMYRPELEEKVGKQGWDWDWQWYLVDIGVDKLQIKFRKGKTDFATYFALKWASR